MVARPACGCQGNPAASPFAVSLGKLYSKRNGSRSLVLPKPKARWSLTPPPSIVGFGSIICFTALNDIGLLRGWHDSFRPVRAASNTSSLHQLRVGCDG